MGSCSSCCSQQEVNTNELVFNQQENKSIELLPSQQEKRNDEFHNNRLFPSKQEVNTQEIPPLLGDNQIFNPEEFGTEEQLVELLKKSYDVQFFEELDLIENEEMIPKKTEAEENFKKKKAIKKEALPKGGEFLKEKESMKIEEVEQLFGNLNYSMLPTKEIARKFHAARNMKTLKKISAELKLDCHNALDDAQKLLLNDNYKKAKLRFAYAYQMRCCCDWVWVHILKKTGNKGHAFFCKNHVNLLL